MLRRINEEEDNDDGGDEDLVKREQNVRVL